MPNAPSNVVDLQGLKRACKACSLQELCLPVGISDTELETLERIIKQKRPLQRGEHLYRSGEPLIALYAVRAGSVKTHSVTDDGQEQVIGFHLPGELLGLDAISEGRHPCAAKALETTSVCEIPFDRLEEIASRVPGLQHQLFRIMSKGLRSDEQFMALLGKKASDQRLAAFLLSLSSRFGQRGYSHSEFHLSMSRSDIANYLGLAVETVSRLFTRFQSAGLIRVERKLIRITDMEGMKRMSGHGESDDSAHLGRLES